MAFKQANKLENGFTIIEAIITIAIGGMILLIVLFAIPTLIRNGRNNQRQQDVTAILDAVSNYQLNNSGAMPANGSNFLQYTKLTYYDKTSVAYTDAALPTASIGVMSLNPGGANLSETNTDTDKVIIYNRRKCDTINAGSTTSKGAGYRDIVAIYGIETRGATGIPKCIKL